MKIGIFDSGLGGLVIAKALIKKFPRYDFVYLGDTKRLPYGNRSHDTIRDFLEESVDFLFKKDCGMVIVACNTASAHALRRIQKSYLPQNYPDRKVLGVIVPTAEAAASYKKVVILATHATVQSGAYERELIKIDPSIQAFSQAAPLLVPLIENDALNFAQPILESYFKPFKKSHVEALILGCTHYPVLKNAISKIMGKHVRVISQADVIPGKLMTYLERHPEIERHLSNNGKSTFYVSELSSAFEAMAQKIIGSAKKFKIATIESKK